MGCIPSATLCAYGASPKNLADAEIHVEQFADGDYRVTVIYDGETLEEDVDYLLRLSEENGIVTVTVTGRGDYSGKQTAEGESYQLSELSLDRTSLELPVFGTTVLQADTGGVPAVLEWSSDNETVATVDQSGCVTAHKYGTATITVSIPGTELSASCQVQTLFYDVIDPSAYYYKHVYWAAEAGITKGYNLEYFGPQLECTRDQMMTFLWRLAGSPKPKTTKSPFSDVKKGDYCFNAIMWAVDNKITNGYPDGTFGVGVPCTREQAMTFMWRMAGKPEPKTTKNPFSDVKKSDYFYKAVLWASENKIANGYADGTYGVGISCLREYMVTFLSRFNSKYHWK